MRPQRRTIALVTNRVVDAADALRGATPSRVARKMLVATSAVVSNRVEKPRVVVNHHAAVNHRAIVNRHAVEGGPGGGETTSLIIGLRELPKILIPLA